MINLNRPSLSYMQQWLLFIYMRTYILSCVSKCSHTRFFRSSTHLSGKATSSLMPRASCTLTVRRLWEDRCSIRVPLPPMVGWWKCGPLMGRSPRKLTEGDRRYSCHSGMVAEPPGEAALAKELAAEAPLAAKGGEYAIGFIPPLMLVL